MPQKLEIEIDEERNEVQINLVDDAGNGIIVLRGKMGGSSFLSKSEQAPRIEVLKRLTLKEG
jgi:hypothetical protein